MSRIKVDFTNVKEPSQYNPKHIEPGEYVGKIKEIVDGKSKADGISMWVVSVVLNDVPGAVYPYYIKLDFSGENGGQAWKVRQLLAAAGFKIPKGVMAIDTAKLVGKAVGAVIEEDEYQGKLKSVIQRLIPVAEVMGPQESAEDEEEEEEEEAPKPARRKPEPEPEDDEDDDLEEEEEEAPAPKKRRTRRKPAPVEEEDDDDEDDEEEEPAPRKRSATRRKAAAPVEDEDDDLDLDDI